MHFPGKLRGNSESILFGEVRNRNRVLEEHKQTFSCPDSSQAQPFSRTIRTHFVGLFFCLVCPFPGNLPQHWNISLVKGSKWFRNTTMNMLLQPANQASSLSCFLYFMDVCALVQYNSRLMEADRAAKTPLPWHTTDSWAISPGQNVF